MKNLEGVQVGDEVVHFRTGRKGTVVSCIGGLFPIFVDWSNEMFPIEAYMIDGRFYIEDIAPSIGFALPKVEYAPRPKRMVVKEIRAYANICPDGSYSTWHDEAIARRYGGDDAIAIAVPLTGSYEVEE